MRDSGISDIRRSAGRLVMAAFRPERDEGSFDEMRRLIGEFGVGGVVVFGGSVESLPQQLAALQSESDHRLMVAADLEWGLSQQVEGGTEFPSTMAMGANGSAETVRDAARAVASEALAIGINTIFCPCADVNTFHGNPIIDVRSFGDDPRQVGEMVFAYVEGVLDAGAIAVAKHFPGHGATSRDSHLDLPTWTPSEVELAGHLHPFKRAIDARVHAIMMGHILIPALDSVAASLSGAVVEQKLRKELEFEGIVFTDALLMKSVSALGGEAGVMAINAGADILLYPEDPKAQIEAVASAVEDGRVEARRILRSLERLDVAVAEIEKTQPGAIGAERTDRHTRLAQDIARKSLTVLRSARAISPIEPGALVVCLDLTDEQSSAEFISYLESRCLSVDVKSLRPQEVAGGLLDEVEDRDRVIVAVFDRVRAYRGQALLPDAIAGKLSSWLENLPNGELVLFSSPYVAEQLRYSGPVLLAYGPSQPGMRAVVDLLCSGGEAPGRLPISLDTRRGG